MVDLSCLCGNSKDVTVVFEQNFTEKMLSPAHFSARGKHDFGADHLHYRILRCKKCDQLFSSPVLDAGRIEGLYRDSVQSYTKETRNIVKAYMSPLDKWMQLLKTRGAALEVACGSGFCLEALKDRGFHDVEGVEPSAHAIEQARADIKRAIRNCTFENTAFDESSFDLICAFQVMDHFLNPLEMMERFYRLLKPGGLCYAIIHDERALQVRMLGEKSPIIDVSHIYYFNRKTLRRLFERSGFEAIDIFNIWNSYTLTTWIRMLPMPFKERLLKVLGAVGLAAFSLTIPAGNIGIIGRKKER